MSDPNLRICNGKPGSRKCRRRRGRNAEPAGAIPGGVDVGLQLRRLRNSQSLSLRALAQDSGLNFNTLSLIENGKTSPSVSTLQQIAAALHVPITAFFQTDPQKKNVVFQKSGRRPSVEFQNTRLEDLGEGLSLRGGKLILLTLPARTRSSPEPITHTGQEFVFCLEGELAYEIDDREYRLGSGDSLIFEAHLPHRWGNPGPSASRSLLILCPADENDRPSERHFPGEPGFAELALTSGS
jgi:transcriptional regulator with XRE-family HTH domain